MPSPDDPATVIPGRPGILLTRGPPADGERIASGHGSDEPTAALVIRYLAQDHDRIAQDLNDLVVRRIFAAGLDLQAVLLLLGDHPASSRIHHVVAELDQAVTDIRDTVFGRPKRD
jgi:signal transduction histidine kinase